MQTINEQQLAVLKQFEITFYDDNGRIWVKPVCELFKIDLRYQVEKINNDPYLKLNCEKIHNFKLFGDNRPRLCMGKFAFLRWILGINPNTVDPAFREGFAEFQKAVEELIFSSLKKLHAISKVQKDIKRIKEERKESSQAIKKKQLNIELMLEHPYQASLALDKDSEAAA